MSIGKNVLKRKGTWRNVDKVEANELVARRFMREALGKAEEVYGSKRLKKVSLEIRDQTIPHVEYTKHYEEEYRDEKGRRGWRKVPTEAKVVIDKRVLQDRDFAREVILHEVLEAEGVVEGAESHNIAVKEQRKLWV